MHQSINQLLGIPLPLTHRQFLTWQEWLGLEWNRPNRADHYSMRVAQAMSGSKLDDYKIEFKLREPPDLTKLTKRELKFYTDCGNDLLAWKNKSGVVHQNALAAAIGAENQ